MAVGFLALANAEIRAAERRHRLEKAERLINRRRVFLIDQLISDLENLNVSSVERVPLSYEGRLAELRNTLRDTIPPDRLEGIRTRIGIARLMDHLFAAQELLFAGLNPELETESQAGEEWSPEAVARGDRGMNHDLDLVRAATIDGDGPPVAGAIVEQPATARADQAAAP